MQKLGKYRKIFLLSSFQTGKIPTVCLLLVESCLGEQGKYVAACVFRHVQCLGIWRQQCKLQGLFLSVHTCIGCSNIVQEFSQQHVTHESRSITICWNHAQYTVYAVGQACVVMDSWCSQNAAVLCCYLAFIVLARHFVLYFRTSIALMFKAEKLRCSCGRYGHSAHLLG